MSFEGILYDGMTAHRQPVTVEPLQGRVDLTYEDGFVESVDARLLKRMERDSLSLRLARSDRSGWRLVLPSDAEAALLPLIGRPERYGRWIDRIGLVPALIGFGAATAAVVAIGYLAPQWIAPHVPYSWERNLGTAIVGDFGDNRCRRAD
ncbi:MAG: hypothetical protein M3177_10260, partial [Pseudomonadota bacterium]|nr:hypothetical protein [Pseudomonadota bacterium]